VTHPTPSQKGSTYHERESSSSTLPRPGRVRRAEEWMNADARCADSSFPLRYSSLAQSRLRTLHHLLAARHELRE